MPRNPNKKRCQVPNCRSWAMHEHAHCRAHLDHKLGPRNGGAPRGNFHNFKSGRYANPLSPAELKTLAHQLASDPDSLPQHLDAAVHDINGRTVNYLHTLILLARFLNQLLPYCAEFEYNAGLEAFIQGLPRKCGPASAPRFGSTPCP